MRNSNVLSFALEWMMNESACEAKFLYIETDAYIVLWAHLQDEMGGWLGISDGVYRIIMM